LAGIFAFCCALGNANAAEFHVVGGVEKVAKGRSEITVLGQRFQAPTSMLANLDSNVGTFVAISGERLADGTLLAKSIKRLATEYVPGASDVYLRGTVDRYSDKTGVVQIGGVQVLNLDASANNSPYPLQMGANIEVVGTQALLGGPIWASKIIAIPTVSTSGVDASLKSTSIQGTGAQATSIQGTGVQAKSIQGTGVLATSIQGTGVLATSIQGTGVQAKSIQGTGALATSIQGTGVLATSIQGTGVQAKSIQGTGVLATSIQGTGVQATSIQGTGVLATSIQGTGVQATSIQGTGVKATSIQGTGAQATSIQGTGVQATSIQGTGLEAFSIQGTGISQD
jgi:hypothetical protein